MTNTFEMSGKVKVVLEPMTLGGGFTKRSSR